MASAAEAVRRTVEDAGKKAARKLSETMTFTIENPLAAAAARKSAARLVTNVSKQTQKALNKAVTQAVSEGVAPRDLAKIVCDLVGLNERQATALINARSRWAEAGLDGEALERAVERYGMKLLKQRAEMIARTETSDAVHDGQRAAWDEAIEEGLLDKETTRRVWIASADSCDLCLELDGQSVGMDEQWESDGEMIDGPPRHPHCTCDEALEIEPAA